MEFLLFSHCLTHIRDFQDTLWQTVLIISPSQLTSDITHPFHDVCRFKNWFKNCIEKPQEGRVLECQHWQWRIQDFHQSGRAIQLFCQMFHENCMKMKEIRPRAGAARIPHAYLGSANDWLRNILTWFSSLCCLLLPRAFKVITVTPCQLL